MIPDIKWVLPQKWWEQKRRNHDRIFVIYELFVFNNCWQVLYLKRERQKPLLRKTNKNKKIELVL